MKAIKITNPLWLGAVAPRVETYVKKLNLPGTTYETYYAYYTTIIQYGGDASELWIAFNEEEPPEAIGYACWFVKGLPFIGTVQLESIHVWDNKYKGAFNLLMGELIEFSKRMRAPILEADCRNEGVVRLFGRACDKFGYDLNRSTKVTCIARKKEK